MYLIAFLCTVSLFFLIIELHTSKSKRLSLEWDQKTEQKTQEVNNQLKKYDDMTMKYYTVNSDTTIYAFKKQIEIAQQNNLQLETIRLYRVLSEYYLYILDDVPNAFKSFVHSLNIYKANKAKSSNPYFYLDMGYLLWKNDMGTYAFVAYNEAKRIALDKKDPFALSIAYNNMAEAYNSMNQYDSARIYYYKSLSAKKRLRPIFYVTSYQPLAELYLKQHWVDSAWHIAQNIENAIKLQQRLPKRFQFNSGSSQPAQVGAKQYVYICKAQCMELKNNKAAAIRYYHQADSVSKFELKTCSTVSIFLHLSFVNQKLGNINEAIKYMNDILDYAKLNKNYELTQQAIDSLASIQFSQRNFIQAIKYTHEASQYDDSIRINQNKNSIEKAKVSLYATILTDFLKEDLKNTHLYHLSLAMFAFFLVMDTLVCYQIIINLKADQKSKGTVSKNTETMIFAKIETDLRTIMEIEKIYLQQNITLRDLSEQLNTNVNYLSQFINSRYQMNFNSYINAFRVKEACSILRSTEGLTLSIEQIASLSGFSSRRAFYDAFKKIIGDTPAAYQKKDKIAEMQS